MGEGEILYERNRPRTQRNPIHQRRHHKNVRLGNGNSRRRSMINNHTPSPRLEPDHQHEEPYDDVSDTDFIQTPEEMDLSDETILDIYHWLIGLGQ